MLGAGGPDATVRLASTHCRAAVRRRGIWAALVVLAACGAGLACWWGTQGLPVRTGDERTILAHVAETPTAFRLAANQAVLVLDFPTLAGQGRALNRLAALVEKAGLPRDRVLDDAALSRAIRASGASPETYYYGHDYRAADVARFFILTEGDRVKLTVEEQWVAGLARQEGWTDPGVTGALLSVPRTGADKMVDAAMRATILRHELSHGEYFTVPAYAAYSLRFWREVLAERERGAFRRFLAGEGYNLDNEDLVVNEAQAYLAHTPDPAVFGPDKVDIPEARLAALRAAFITEMPLGWLRDMALSAAAPGRTFGPARSSAPKPRRRPGCRPGARRPAQCASPVSRKRPAPRPAASLRIAAWLMRRR